jgi:hypothetical protein
MCGAKSSGFDQIGLQFEIMISASGAMTNAGIQMCAGRKP